MKNLSFQTREMNPKDGFEFLRWQVGIFTKETIQVLDHETGEVTNEEVDFFTLYGFGATSLDALAMAHGKQEKPKVDPRVPEWIKNAIHFPVI